MLEGIPSSPENSPEKYYKEYKAVELEIENLINKMEEVLNTNTNKEEAEKIILNEYTSKMDSALSKSREYFDKWHNSLKQR